MRRLGHEHQGIIQRWWLLWGIFAIWTAAVIPMNAHLTADQAQRGLVMTPEAPHAIGKTSA
jgi:NitT/TauT family transport system permease protein